MKLVAKADDLFGDADDNSSEEEEKAKKVAEKAMRITLEDDEEGDEFETEDLVIYFFFPLFSITLLDFFHINSPDRI